MPYYEVSLCIRSVIEKEEAGLFILGWVNGGTHMGKPLILASLVIIKAQIEEFQALLLLDMYIRCEFVYEKKEGMVLWKVTSRDGLLDHKLLTGQVVVGSHAPDM